MKYFNEFKKIDQKTKGKSPSGAAKLNPLGNTKREDGFQNQSSTWQLKQSNATKPIRQQIGLNEYEDDLIGEAIATDLGEVFFNSNNPQDPERSPHMDYVLKSTVLGDDANELLIASRYMNDAPPQKGNFVGMTLDEVMEKRVDGKRGKGRHAVIVNGDASNIKNGLPLGQPIDINIAKKGEPANIINVTVDKKQLYEVLAFSFLIGDADVNPGNAFLSYNKTTGESSIGRIDYGHVFNDLIKSWGPLADGRPKLEPGRGVVLDALNRKGLNGDKITKFRRDYRGVIPDAEFAQALRDTADKMDEKAGDLKQALENAKGKLQFLMGLENSIDGRDGIYAGKLADKEAENNLASLEKAAAQKTMSVLIDDRHHDITIIDTNDPKFVEKVKEKYSEEFNLQLDREKHTFKEGYKIGIEIELGEEPHVSNINKMKMEMRSQQDDIFQSLVAINAHIGKPLTEDQIRQCRQSMESKKERNGFEDDVNIEIGPNILDTTFRNIEGFLDENTKEMRSVANVIEVQSIIEQKIKGKISDEEATKQITALYDNDDRYLGNSFELQVDKLHKALNSERVDGNARQEILDKIIHNDIFEDKFPDGLPNNLLTNKDILKEFIKDNYGKEVGSVKSFLSTFQEDLEDNHPLKNYKGQGKYNQRVEWVRNDDDKEPFKGTITEYISHRRSQLKDLGKVASKEIPESEASKSGETKEGKPGQKPLFTTPSFFNATRGAFAQGGAAIGATIGFAVGSVFPGVGNLAGAAIGAVVGGVVGALVPEMAKLVVGIANVFRRAANHFRREEVKEVIDAKQKVAELEVEKGKGLEKGRDNLKDLKHELGDDFKPKPDWTPHESRSNNNKKGFEKF